MHFTSALHLCMMVGIMLTQLTPRCNLWIEADGQVVLSKWRIQLLEAVDQAGSISGAAEKMGIQYRLAWDRLEEMENGLGVRLVERHVGGVHGGGATLTEAGREYIERFTHLAEEIDAVVAERFEDAFGDRSPQGLSDLHA
jgi:molybdate transport system regulatory protein